MAVVLGITAVPTTALPAEPAPRVLAEAALQTPKAQGAAMLAVTRAGSRLVAVGERGTVLLSDDDGARWRQAAASAPCSPRRAAACSGCASENQSNQG